MYLSDCNRRVHRNVRYVALPGVQTPEECFARVDAAAKQCGRVNATGQYWPLAIFYRGDLQVASRFMRQPQAMDPYTYNTYTEGHKEYSDIANQFACFIGVNACPNHPEYANRYFREHYRRWLAESPFTTRNAASEFSDSKRNLLSCQSRGQFYQLWCGSEDPVEFRYADVSIFNNPYTGIGTYDITPLNMDARYNERFTLAYNGGLRHRAIAATDTAEGGSRIKLGQFSDLVFGPMSERSAQTGKNLPPDLPGIFYASYTFAEPPDRAFSRLTLQQARQYCRKPHNGYNDWRLPTMAEALSLAGKHERLNYDEIRIAFGSSSLIWTSSTFENQPLRVNLGSAEFLIGSPPSNNMRRPVRSLVAACRRLDYPGPADACMKFINYVVGDRTERICRNAITCIAVPRRDESQTAYTLCVRQGVASGW